MSDLSFMTVRLPLKIGPHERGDMWEDPLADLIEPEEIAEVTGGGTMLADDGGIEFCELEIELADLSKDRLDKIQAAMLTINAPKNTKFIDADGKVLRTFGTTAVVGIGLDGAGLPDSAYEGFSPDAFNNDVLAALGDGHSYGGSYAGKRYTYFYYHGPNGDVIRQTLEQFASDQPICQGAKFEQLA